MLTLLHTFESNYFNKPLYTMLIFPMTIIQEMSEKNTGFSFYFTLLKGTHRSVARGSGYVNFGSRIFCCRTVRSKKKKLNRA